MNDLDVTGSMKSARTPAANYRELFRIGSGGFATISVAVAQGFEGFTKLVVLKTLREELGLQPGVTKMFLDEARLLARMSHPNIVHVFDVFRQGNAMVIVMEYVDGQALNKIQSRCRETDTPFGLDLGISILTKVLGALHYAHGLKDFGGEPLGLIHRDVSPHNVMVTYDGQVKLLDFGIAKLMSGQLRSVEETCAGVFKGKLTYMAPEQLVGQVDPRSDVFAVGVMLWELVAQRRYWSQASDLAIVRCLSTGELPHLAERVDMDRDLASICNKALAHDVTKRYASAGAMQEDLERYLSSRGIVVSENAVGHFVTERCAEARSRVQSAIRSHMLDLPTASGKFEVPPSDSLLTAAETVHPGNRRSRAKIVGLASLGVLVASVGGWELRRMTAPAASPVVVAPPTSVPAASPSVRFRTHAQPAGVVWYLDDMRLGADPIDIKLPRDDAAHTLRAEAEGHLPFLRTIRIDADVEVMTALAPKLAEPVRPPIYGVHAPRYNANRFVASTPAVEPLAAPTGASVTAKRDSVSAPAPTAAGKKESPALQFGDSLKRVDAAPTERARRSIDVEFPGAGE